MIILAPELHETIWGGTRLKYISQSEKKIGHIYMVNGHEEMSNIVINGLEKGKTLREIFGKYKHAWGMDAFEEFPLTIALVDASADLSIQVHPDDKTAQELEQKQVGKKESWLFLSGPENGWIYGGCTCKTKEELYEAVALGRMEDCAEHFPVQRFDYVCVSAGTLHSMTKGSLVYEIEYGSDYTYRFYDFDRVDAKGRKRELHVEKAKRSVKPQLRPKLISKFNEVGHMEEDVYEVDYRENVTGYRNESNILQCVSVIEGSGVCDGIAVKPGNSILLLPGEEVQKVAFEKAVIASLK